MPEHQIESPEWWLERLTKKLGGRRPRLRNYRAYYDGRHQIQFDTEQFKDAFGALLREFTNNFCRLVVQAPAERMQVQGIRLGPDETHDRDAWAMWQENNMDAQSAMHHTSLLTTGYGYVLVWGDSDGEGKPVFTVEDPLQVVVDYRPGTRKRAAALKRWVDDWTGHEMAYVYLPEGIYKFRSRKKRTGTDVTSGYEQADWERWSPEGEEWPLANPLDVVPMVEFLNDPGLSFEGRSEIAPVIPLQDAINKLGRDLLVASEYGAFRQRVVLGWEPEIDEETGKPKAEAFEASLRRFWYFGDKDVKTSEFSATDLNNYIKSAERYIQDMAVQTRTPRHYFHQSGQQPSGDSIKSAEASLVAKVRELEIAPSESYEEVHRLGFKVMGDDRANVTDAEIVWRDPEYRTDGQLADAVVKLHQSGILPRRFALEKLGYSPQEIERIEGLFSTEKMLDQGVDISELLPEEQAAANA